MKTKLKLPPETEKYPYVYKEDSGEARFVSKEMYRAMIAKCRCGRRRTETHILKCLQKVEQGDTEDDLRASTTPQNFEDVDGEENMGRGGISCPVTSSGEIIVDDNDHSRNSI